MVPLLSTTSSSVKRPTRGTERRGVRPGVPALLALGALALAGHAEAQSTGDAAAAEELFRQAKALINQGAYEQACPKLAESHRLDPAGGTVLTLALCYRAQGKTASAWASFQEALSRAKQDRRADRERVAQREIASLEPRLSRLRVRVEPAAAALPGFRLLRDGQPLGSASYGVATPVDPGGHEVAASADGYKSFRAEVQVGGSTDLRDVLVPVLEPEPPPVVPPPVPSVTAPLPAPPAPRAPSPAAPPAPEGASWRQKAVGYGGLGLGTALVGVALYYGYRVKVDRDEARERCPSNPCSDQQGVRRNDAARDKATVANVSGVLGLAALGVGLYVTLRSAPASAPAPGAAPQRASLVLVPGPLGASLTGSF